jgi:VIT1/CCC1 family predicted Fe2+/Mn2+ transporter
MMITVSEAEERISEVELLQSSRYIDRAHQCATILREELQADLDANPGLLPLIGTVERKLDELGAIKQGATPAQESTSASPTSPTTAAQSLFHFDGTEDALKSAGSTYGFLSIASGVVLIVLAFVLFDERQTSLRVVLCTVAVNAMLIGVFASTLAVTMARVSVRIRRIDARIAEHIATPTKSIEP